MHINFKYANNRGLNPIDILTLQIIKQLRTDKEVVNELATVLQDERLGFYVDKKWVTQIKGKKSDDELSRLRLTKSGNKLMENIETAEVTEDTIKIFDWISTFYVGEEDKFVGNKKRTKQGLAQFAKETGISRNHLSYLIQNFLKSESFDYSYKLENLLFSSKNLYSRKFSLDECRLNDFYLKNKSFFDSKFDNINN